MAEGSDHSSLLRGSDVVFEYKCNPCAGEGNFEESQKYCLDCKEYLCAACIKYHVKFTATKNHILKDNNIQHRESDSVNTASKEDENKIFKCLYHPDRDIEMYCGTHEMVFCTLCIAKEHRHCEGIFDLEEAAEKIPLQNEDILVQIQSLQADVHAKRQTKEVNMIALDKAKNDIKKTIEDTKRLIISKVEELASDAQEKACSKCADLKKDIEDEDTVLLQVVTESDELKCKVETEVELDAKQQFARYVLQKHAFAQIEKKHKSVEKDEKKLKYLKNDMLLQQISTADSLGQVVGSKTSINSEGKTLHKKSQKEVNIKGNGDKMTCHIISICQLFDGSFIIADFSNKSLKRLNEGFRITETLNLDSNPIEVCLIGKDEVAVKVKNCTILFVSVDRNLIVKNSIAIEGENLIGLAFICNELWCYTGNGIKVYNKEGSVMKTFSDISFKEIQLLIVIPVAADKEFVYISDLDNRIACIDREGNIYSIFEFSGRLKRVRKACIAQNGIIFLAGKISGNIMMFNENGKCLGELVEGLEKPDALCYNNTHQLIIGHELRNT